MCSKAFERRLGYNFIARILTLKNFVPLKSFVIIRHWSITKFESVCVAMYAFLSDEPLFFM